MRMSALYSVARTLTAGGHAGDGAVGAGPGREAFPQLGYVVRGQAVGGEPVIGEVVEPLAGVGEVLGGQARSRSRARAVSWAMV
jgi:hypothetical protein